MFLDELEKFTLRAKNRQIYPNIRKIQGPSSDPEVLIDGKKYLSFSSNNYLGLAQNHLVVDTAKKALEKYGVGPASARLMSGNLDVYERLEEKTASFIGFEGCVLFSSGYMANIGTITSLSRPPYVGLFPFFKKHKEVLVISDEFNHASIVDGVRLAKVDKVIFKHNDMDSLSNILEENKHKEKFIIVDGVYSMDGDLAPLKEIVELKKRYSTVLMVDDAHGTGVLGQRGRGTFEHAGLDSKDIDILMGTYVKAFGTVGGFICCKKEIADYLKVSARSYVFSISIPPSCAEATIKAIEIVAKDKTLRKKVLSNAEYLRKRLNTLGFDTLDSTTPIIPVIIGEEVKGIQFEEGLFKRGILAPCVRWPAVEKGKSRLRLSVMSTHKKNQIDFLIENLEALGKTIGII